jgi:NhaA family Na+:H+ antiporter
LKVFLAALAIADDLGAVVVIAVFYTETIRLGALAMAAAGFVLLKAAAGAGVRRIEIYALLFFFIWIAITASNLHPTVAGVLAAFAMPVRAEPDSGKPAMGPAIEEYLHPAIAFVILPLFALFNAGVAIRPETVQSIGRPVGLGILVGLILGKQIGIIAFSWLAVTTGKAALPDGVSWTQTYAVACLAGIGFTMSLFVTDLAFVDGPLAEEAKAAILLASVLAAAWGAAVLRAALPPDAA